MTASEKKIKGRARGERAALSLLLSGCPPPTEASETRDSTLPISGAANRD